MHFDVPSNIEPKVQEFARAQHISENEAILRILKAGLEVLPTEGASQSRQITYSSLFGSVKGGYGSTEAIDRAISEMRSEWPA